MSKFKSVSVRDTTFDVIDKLSIELLPKVQLSKAQTIDRIAAIAEKTIKNIYNVRTPERAKNNYFWGNSFFGTHVRMKIKERYET